MIGHVRVGPAELARARVFPCQRKKDTKDIFVVINIWRLSSFDNWLGSKAKWPLFCN